MKSALESVPPVEPAQPDVPETSGNAMLAIPDSASAPVAFSLKEPVPAGRNQSVVADESQYWLSPPETSVGAVTVAVGAVVSTSASADEADAVWLPTRSDCS